MNKSELNNAEYVVAMCLVGITGGVLHMNKSELD